MNARSIVHLIDAAEARQAPSGYRTSPAMTDISPGGGPDAQYQAHLAAGRFMIQRGRDSGASVFFPRAVAPVTGEELEWVEASGRGTVYSTTVIRKRIPEPDVNIALIDLAEGVRMMSRVEGIAPDAVTIGMAVQARIVADEDERLVVFDPVAGGAA